MIKIIADSTCDLSQEIIERYKISLVSLNVIINGRSYRDRIDIMPDEFYKLLKEVKEHPTTSMPSPNEFLTAYETAVADGYDEIICICMSSGTSGSYQSAILAKNLFYEEEEYREVKLHVVDSHSMSLGSGWLIMKTAEMIEKNYSYQEIIDYNEGYKNNVKHYLCVDDLDNLIKSGRLTNASAFIGKILRIKPIMTMRNKRGAIVAKERGLNRVINHYIREFESRVNLEETTFINIGYTDDIKRAETLKERLISEVNYKGEIYIMQKGASVGTHVGSGGLSMFFLEKGNKHDGLISNEIKEKKEKLKNLLK